MLDEKDYLAISEDFYSVQCEGLSSGYPAYFIRLMNCNLRCGASKGFLQSCRKGEIDMNPDTFQGDLHKEGKATWTCDSIPVWIKGHKKPMHYLVDRFVDQEIDDWVNSGRIHLIWTGGEPLMKVNQECIVSFLWFYDKLYPFNTVYNEIETNGTQYIEDELFERLDQINCSVKLANSGHSKQERIIPKALQRIMEHENYWFKFVISTEDDLKEIEEDFIKPFEIPPHKICMMPGLDDQDDFHERTAFVLEMAKKYGYIGLSRLHISAWNKTTGV